MTTIMKKRTLLAVLIAAVIAFVGIGSYHAIANLNPTTPSSASALASDDSDKDSTSSASAEEAQSSWYFYHDDVLETSSTDDDFNFGLKGNGSSASEYYQDFYSRLKTDPALGAATFAWVDANLGTRIMGDFKPDSDSEWKKQINAAIAAWYADPDAYAERLTAFNDFCDKYATVTVEDGKVLSDQMYMYSLAGDKYPTVVVLKTDNHEGKFLVFTFKIKDNNFSVRFRIDCGYQPTDVAGIMNIETDKTPDKPQSQTGTPSGGSSTPSGGSDTPSGGGDTPSGGDDTPSGGGDTPSGGGDTPSGGDDDTPSKSTPKKDKSKGTQGSLVDKNDGSGPGENTNSGKDSTTSSKDSSTKNGGGGSSTDGSYSDYQQKVQENKDANTNANKSDSSSSSSSSSGSSKVTTDDNSKSGTGNGGVDQATPTQEPAKTSGGETIINSGDNAAGEWEGPSD